jgi:hypothetical protein
MKKKMMNPHQAAVLVTTLLVTALVLAGPVRSDAQPQKDVVVVNDQNNPVPVVAEGTTVVSGKVSVDNTPNVQVANTAANPALVRNVDEGSRQPFHLQLRLDLPSGTDSQSVSFTLPSGKRLVIEFVSMRGILPPNQSVFMNILTYAPTLFNGQLGVGSAFHNPLVVDQGMFGVQHFVGVAQQLRIYAEPNQPVRVDIGRDLSFQFPGGEASFTVTLSGYLVDVP